MCIHDITTHKFCEVSISGYFNNILRTLPYINILFSRVRETLLKK